MQSQSSLTGTMASPPPISQGGKQTVGTLESLISVISDPKDSLHIPDHSIRLRGIPIRYPLHCIKTLRNAISQRSEHMRKITICSILTNLRGNKPEESRLKKKFIIQFINFLGSHALTLFHWKLTSLLSLLLWFSSQGDLGTHFSSLPFPCNRHTDRGWGELFFLDLDPLLYGVVPPGVHALTGQLPRVRLFASSTFCCLVVIDKDFVGKAVLWHFYLQTLLTL